MRNGAQNLSMGDFVVGAFGHARGSIIAKPASTRTHKIPNAIPSGVDFQNPPALERSVVLTGVASTGKGNGAGGGSEWRGRKMGR